MQAANNLPQKSTQNNLLKVRLTKPAISTTGKALMPGTEGKVLDFVQENNGNDITVYVIVDFGLGWEVSSLPANSQFFEFVRV